MNSCTMARKLVVSVVRTVVGARREALERFLPTFEADAGSSDNRLPPEAETDPDTEPFVGFLLLLMFPRLDCAAWDH